MSSKRGKPTGQGYNFGKGEKAERMKKNLARMRRDPEYTKSLFGNPVKRSETDATDS